MKIHFDLGEFRNLEDEKPLSAEFIEASKIKAKKIHDNIDYVAVISELEEKLKSCSPKDKQNYLSVLETSKRQQAAGFGIK